MAEKSEKLRKKELKAPDAFQRAGGQASHWLAERKKVVAIAVAVVVLGGAGVALAEYVSSREEQRAARDLGEALKVLSRPVAGLEQVEPGQQAFTSGQERDEALRKALEEFRSKYKGTRAAVTATLPLGKAHHRLGAYDAALAAFGDYLREAPQGEVLRAGALEGQGYVYEAKGQLGEALKAFEQMAREPQEGYLRGMGAYHQGRILALQDKKDEAARLLAQVPVDHPNTAAARLASERLTVLAAQGVKVPEVKPAAPAPGAPDAG